MPSRGAHARGCRDRHAHAHDHARASGGCRGPRGPNVLRAIASLRDSGRNADASNMLLHTEDAPSVPAPICSGDQLAPNIPRPKRNPEWEAVQDPRKRRPVAESRYTPILALNSVRQ